MKSIRLLIPALWAVSSVLSCAAADSPEKTALAVLASGAELHEKARACQELSVYGGPASVAPLAALLDQEHLSDYARSGLENVRDPAAGAALRSALGRVKGRQLAGVVNSLGVRRDAAAVRDLQKLAVDPKSGVATEALASLGMIATPEATKVLQQVMTQGPNDLRLPAAHALLFAAEQLTKDKNPSGARKLLDSVARAQPSPQLASVAKARVTALGSK